MATYTVSRAKHATLVGSTADTVTLKPHENGVEVRNRATADVIYVTFDGAVPTVAGNDSFYIAAGEIYYYRKPTTRVRLISSGAAAYSVQGVA